jgi:hypothetical protein
MKWIVSLCLLLVLCSAFAGCDQLPSSNSDPDGFLGQDSNGVYWLVYYDPGLSTSAGLPTGKVKGTYDSEYLNAGKLTSATYLVHGTETNNKVNLIFQMANIQIPVQGMLSADNVIKLAMNENGKIQTKTLTGAFYGNWQDALATFKAKHKG